ncbi:MAG TPA: hypothetical protein VMB50_19510 [Myxococcales bacterium]|nr:hypothetical protein [Myxococcales bacterium]
MVARRLAWLAAVSLCACQLPLPPLPDAGTTGAGTTTAAGGTSGSGTSAGASSSSASGTGGGTGTTGAPASSGGTTSAESSSSTSAGSSGASSGSSTGGSSTGGSSSGGSSSGGGWFTGAAGGLTVYDGGAVVVYCLPAEFAYPYGVAVDGADDVYVADTHDDVIRRIAPDGGLTTLAGVFGDAGYEDGPNDAARFSGPIGVAVDDAGTTVYVSDPGNSRIREVDLASGFTTTLAGNADAGWNDGPGVAAQFNTPYGLALGPGVLYVADNNNYRVREVALDGGWTSTLVYLGEFNQPDAVAVDPGGNVYYTTGFDLEAVGDGGTSTTINDYGSLVTGVAIDRAGNTYVADSALNCIWKGSLDGASTPSPLAGTCDGGTALFDFPAGVAVDGQGRVFVADEMNNRICAIVQP